MPFLSILEKNMPYKLENMFRLSDDLEYNNLSLEIGLLSGIVKSKTFLSHRHTYVFVWHKFILYTYSWSSLFTLCPTVECKYFNEKILLPQTAFLRNFQSLRETRLKGKLEMFRLCVSTHWWSFLDQICW